MTPEVEEHVGAGVADLAGGLQDSQMIALGEYRSRAAGQGVEATGQTDAEALHAPREMLGAVGFHHGVDVIGLQGPVDDTEAITLARRPECATDDLNAPLGAQAD